MSRRHIEIEPIKDLEAILDYTFKEKKFLRQALTHSSAIPEDHPLAFEKDNKTLAFIGDSLLKYVVARHIYEDGRPDFQGKASLLHQGTQAIIPNKVLADVAKRKLYLEKYLIRGNSHRIASDYMYATCLEAIFGAVALDCKQNQHETVSNVIRNICADQYRFWLEPRIVDEFVAQGYTEDQRWIMVDPDSLDERQRLHQMYENNRRHQPEMSSFAEGRSWCSILGRFILWLFAIIGISVVIKFLVEESELLKPTRKWYEF